MKMKSPEIIVLVASIVLVSLVGPGLAQGAAWDSLNRPDRLRSSWNPLPIETRLNRLKYSAALDSAHTPWADSYWPKQRGAMAYRWQQHSDPNMEQQLSRTDRQNLFFRYHLFSKAELKKMSAEQIDRLSPLEKFSIYIGDDDYSLVKDYWRKNSADDAYWEGYCHAWAVAALQYTEPAPVEKTNADGIRIRFGSADVKALLIANIADEFGFSVRSAFTQKAERRQMGMKCEKRFQYPQTKIRKGIEVMDSSGDTSGMVDAELESKVSEYQTSALRIFERDHGLEWIKKKQPSLLKDDFIAKSRVGAEDPACVDTNAGAFHLFIANQIGEQKRGFVFDKTRDLEIWNQPAYRYESEILPEELAPLKTSAPGTRAVKKVKTHLYYADDMAYGYAFYFPTLTGLFQPDHSNHKRFLEEHLRYGQLLINEGDEKQPLTYPHGIVESIVYDYTLDLDQSGNVIGGDWISFDRPDFIWVMENQPLRGRFERVKEIYSAARELTAF